MSRVLVVQHDRLATLGWLGEALAEAGVEVEVVDLGAGAAVPDRVTADAVVSLGGDMGAYAEAAHPWLVGEKALLARMVADGVPVLGICLGAQILADALGGRAHPAAAPEIGFYELSLTEEGRRDPVLCHLEGPVLEWHGDTFDLPPGAIVLATSDQYPQAYRVGSALAVQFHPETTPDMLATWVAELGREDPSAAPIPEGLAMEGRGRAMVLEATARRLFESWIAHSRLE